MRITNYDSETGVLILNQRFRYENVSWGAIKYLLILIHNRLWDRAWNFVRRFREYEL